MIRKVEKGVICPEGTREDKGGTGYQAVVLGKDQERD